MPFRQKHECLKRSLVVISFELQNLTSLMFSSWYNLIEEIFIDHIYIQYIVLDILAWRVKGDTRKEK